jgi:hypothetical protein
MLGSLFPLGSVTRSQSWDEFVNEGHANDLEPLLHQRHMRKDDLVSQFSKIDQTVWKGENDMYSSVIEAMQSTIYSNESHIFVVPTRNESVFRPGICVGACQDDRLPYFVQYFLDMKLPSADLLTPDSCGLMLDHFRKAFEKQPHRQEMIGILSNFVAAWVFIAREEMGMIKIAKQSAPCLADAIIYADAQSQLHDIKHMPVLDKPFTSDFGVLAISKHHFLLRVPMPSLETTPATQQAPFMTEAEENTNASADSRCWMSPSRHSDGGHFVLKIVHGDANVTQEAKILKEIKDAHCVHLPELVWAPKDGTQLGVVPAGRPIDFQQKSSISRKIVEGLVDGLEYLHSRGIVHRDIRPSNLVLDQSDNVVIIDYETALVLSDECADYLGGYICWPKRHLESGNYFYDPEPADDLFACILVVLHMLFPARFDAFPASRIRVPLSGQDYNDETAKLLLLWQEIKLSRIWGVFVKAAQDKDYTSLKHMADVFCHV